MMFLTRLRRNRNCDSCEKNATGTEKTGIHRIPAGIGNLAPDWTDWNGPLTAATNHIITRFLSDIIGVPVLPHHALLIAQLSLNAGGLGILDPRTQAIPDFMLAFTSSTRHATKGIYLNKHLNNVHIHSTIPVLYSTTTNPHSIILKRYHHILPHIATSACPPTTPQTDLAQYFLTTLSPHSARGRLKNHSTAIVTAELYNHVFEHENYQFTSFQAFSPPTHPTHSLQCPAAVSSIASPR
jgi:hypothetical protein